MLDGLIRFFIETQNQRVLKKNSYKIRVKDV